MDLPNAEMVESFNLILPHIVKIVPLKEEFPNASQLFQTQLFATSAASSRLL